MAGDKKKKKGEIEGDIDASSSADAVASGSATERESKKKKKEKSRDKALRTNLGDTATIKRILDDAVIEIFLEEDELGYAEDTSMSNLKLIVGFTAVGASLLSHVYPAPFPRNWWCLLLCCTTYFVLSGVLQLLLSFVELETILLVRPNAKCKQRGLAGLNVSSHFPRFQEVYTLAVTPLPSGRLLPQAGSPTFRPDLPGGNTSPYCMQRSWSIEKYFDEEGDFTEEEFQQAVRDMMHEYEATLVNGAEGKKSQ